MTTSWARSRAFSLVMMRLTWVLAVSGDRNRRAGDLVVGQALGDQRQHLALPFGQPGQHPVAGRRPFGAGGQVGDEPPGHARRQQRVAPGHHPDRLEQVGGLGVLDQEAAGPGADRLVDVLVGLEGGQDDHLDPGQVVVGGDAPGGFQAVHPGHPDVHQHHVGALAAGQVDRLRAVGGLAHHLEVVGRVDQHVEPGADQRLVVGEQDPDHGACLPPGRGRRLWSAAGLVGEGQPGGDPEAAAGPGPASTAPPTAAARSRIPASPCPPPGRCPRPGRAGRGRCRSRRSAPRRRS